MDRIDFYQIPSIFGFRSFSRLVPDFPRTSFFEQPFSEERPFYSRETDRYSFSEELSMKHLGTASSFRSKLDDPVDDWTSNRLWVVMGTRRTSRDEEKVPGIGFWCPSEPFRDGSRMYAEMPG
jgi:hypothetical protein